MIYKGLQIRGNRNRILRYHAKVKYLYRMKRDYLSAPASEISLLLLKYPSQQIGHPGIYIGSDLLFLIGHFNEKSIECFGS